MSRHSNISVVNKEKATLYPSDISTFNQHGKKQGVVKVTVKTSVGTNHPIPVVNHGN